MSQPTKSILVAGSLNMDFIIQVSSLPVRGETIQGRNFQTLPGGKGANQAYAAARLGGQVIMSGCVGNDLSGNALRNNLQSAGVDVSHVRTVSDASTGVALITVGANGENTIVIDAGANQFVTASEVESGIATLRPACVLLQLETPLNVVIAAARKARETGATVILDPAPAQMLPRTLLECTDILTPNETEALTLLNKTGNAIDAAQSAEIGRDLLASGVGRVILKLGDKGAALIEPDTAQFFAAQRVDAVDTTAAGDCFNAALAVRLTEGATMTQAITFANRAAAISVTRPGAQASMPTRREVSCE